MTYICPTWEFVADAYLLKLQHLQDKVLRITGNFLRRTPIHELNVAFNIQYVYDFITQLCKQQAKAIQNHVNVTVRNMGQGEAKVQATYTWWRSGLQPFKRLSRHYKGR
jgi:hypothetical protein